MMKRRLTIETTKVREVNELEMFCAVHEVW